MYNLFMKIKAYIIYAVYVSNYICRKNEIRKKQMIQLFNIFYLKQKFEKLKFFQFVCIQ